MCRPHRRGLLLGLAGAVLTSAWLAGCGGGSDAASRAPGTMTVTIHWPQAASRLVPQNTLSVTLQATSANAAYTGALVNVNNPSLSTDPAVASNPITVTAMVGLPHTTDYVLVVNAYSGVDHTGTLIASATVSAITVVAGANTAETITLASAVTSVSVALVAGTMTGAQGNGTTAGSGNGAYTGTDADATGTATLTAYSAYTSPTVNAVVPIAPGTVTWVSTDPAVASISGSADNPRTLTLHAVVPSGTASVTGTYAEAGSIGGAAGPGVGGQVGNSSVSFANRADLTLNGATGGISPTVQRK